jgi:Leucine-rich repeat (LRR) protein
MATAESVDALPARSRGPSRRYALVLIVAAGAATGAYWLWSERANLAAETSAAKALQELGALVVMDGARGHVASVNLSTLQSADALAEAIERLPALGPLTSLDASRTQISDDQLAVVSQLPSLTTLSLTETAIADRGVALLRSLENLQTLYLGSTQITNDALPLSGLRELRILDISATKVSGNLASLAELPQLEWLVLRDLELTDDALPPLGRSQSLRRLSLEGSTYSPASLETLQKALPKLSVDR